MGRPERVRRPVGWPDLAVVVVVVTVAGAAALATTGSAGWTVGSAAIVALLIGSATVFGVFDGRERRGPPEGLAPDGRTAALAEHVLGSLDRIEHRRVELGTPWPQLSIGPTGVVVVDVCGVEGPVLLDATGVRRRDDRRSCRRCCAALQAGDAARRALAPIAADVPVRTIAVVAPGTSVTIGLDAPAEVSLITVDELADTLTRGPVLSMATVEAAFAVLSRTAVSPVPR